MNASFNHEGPHVTTPVNGVIPHQTTVTFDRTKPYPYRPQCTCGKAFWGYAANHAAQTLADLHSQGHAQENTAFRQHHAITVMVDLQSDTFAYGLPPIAWKVDETGTKVTGGLPQPQPGNAATFDAWRAHLAIHRSLPMTDLAPRDRDERRARTTTDTGVMVMLSIAIEPAA